MAALTWERVIARRLSRQHLIKPAPRSALVDVVSEVCGIHAQVMQSAELSLALRVNGLHKTHLDTALWERRELVKMTGLRGTIHIFPAREYGFWLAALRAGAPERQDPTRLRYLGLTEREYERVVEAIGAVVGREPLTREELGERVARRVGRWTVTRTVGGFGGGESKVWQAGLGTASQRGMLCFGPPQGARVTFVRPEDWLGARKRVDDRAALAELFVRYLKAYGPATERDFAQWTAFAPARVRGLAASCGDAIEPVEVEGANAWQIAGDRAPRVAARSTLLVPRFDAYVVGSHPRDVVIPPRIVERVTATGLLSTRYGSGRAFLAGPMPVLLIDGVVAGIWESRRSARRVDVRVQPFVTLNSSRKAALKRAASRIADVVGLESSLAIGAISTRPHL